MAGQVKQQQQQLYDEVFGNYPVCQRSIGPIDIGWLLQLV